MSGRHIYIPGSHTGTLYIGDTSNLYLSVMQHKEARLEGFTADYAASACSTSRAAKTFAKPSLGKNNSKAGGAKKKLKLIRTINPEFKDLAQTWGWKMISVHEKMYT